MEVLLTVETGSTDHEAEVLRDQQGCWVRWRGPKDWREAVGKLYLCGPLPALPTSPSAQADDEVLAAIENTALEAFDIFKWRNLESLKAIAGMRALAVSLATIHDAGFCLQGLRRNELLFDLHTGDLMIASLPRLQPLGDLESVWRDLRLFGELAFENFLDQEYPGGHRLVEILQNRKAMATTGLTIPGLSQLLAGCVTPHGDLAITGADELIAALDQLAREITPVLRLHIGARSTIGNHIFRQNNQDSCGYVEMASHIGSQPLPVGFYCVADGIGGIQDGEKASALAVQTSCAAFTRAWSHYSFEKLRAHPVEFARAITRVTSQRIALEGEFSPGQNRGGTTFTALLVAGDRAGIAHVGDSRATLIRDEKIIALTQDHTLATILAALQEEAQDEAASHRTISRFLTTSAELEWSRISSFHPDLAEILGLNEEILFTQGLQLLSGDLILLTSDGAHDEVDEESLSHLATHYKTTPQRLADAIVEQSLSQIGRDNATVIAIYVE